MLEALAASPADPVRKRMDKLARADGAARLIAAADSLAKPSQCLERTLDVEGARPSPACRLCKEGLCVARPRIAVQGFGNAGTAFARAACANGAVIVAASASRSLVHDRDGLDLDALDARTSGTGKVGQSGDPESIFAIDCDVLVLAAEGDSVTGKTAQEIKAVRLVEIANAPVSGEGYQVLDARGTQRLPEILANAGGVVGSYFEWRAFARTGQPDNDAL